MGILFPLSMPTLTDLGQLRPAQADDIAYLYNSYLTSLRRNSVLRHVPQLIYFPHQTQVMRFLLQSSRCLVLAHADDQTQIMAYILYEIQSSTLVVHFIYTRELFRELGIASNIINHLIKSNNIDLLYYTHQTNAVPDIFDKLSIRPLYHPYWIPEGMLRAEVV